MKVPIKTRTTLTKGADNKLVAWPDSEVSAPGTVHSCNAHLLSEEQMELDRARGGTVITF